MRLRRKVKHRVNLVLPQQLGYEGGIPDIAFDKYVPRVPIEIGQRTAIARISQQVEVDQFADFPIRRLQGEANKIAADKSGTAGNEEVHRKRLKLEIRNLSKIDATQLHFNIRMVHLCAGNDATLPYWSIRLSAVAMRRSCTRAAATSRRSAGS